MNFSGTHTIDAPLGNVWAFLCDVNQVAPCAPGFQSLETIEEEQWKAVVSVGVGVVKARFTLDVTRPEMHEPDFMLVKARGKAPGSAVEMSGTMHLTVLSDEQTQKEWKADVVVSGAIASVGARLLSGLAERLTQQFFCMPQIRGTSTPYSERGGARTTLLLTCLLTVHRPICDRRHF